MLATCSSNPLKHKMNPPTTSDPLQGLLDIYQQLIQLTVTLDSLESQADLLWSQLTPEQRITFARSCPRFDPPPTKPTK